MAWPHDWAPSEEVAGPGSTGESNSSVLLLCPEWAHLSPNFWKKHILWMKTTSWEEEVCSQHSYHELDEWTSIWSLIFLTTLCLLYLRTYWRSYTASRTYKWHCSCMYVSCMYQWHLFFLILLTASPLCECSSLLKLYLSCAEGWTDWTFTRPLCFSQILHTLTL